MSTEAGGLWSDDKTYEEAPPPREPDAWLVPWFRANGDAGASVYVKEDDARSAAKNLEMYSASETTADVIPLYADSSHIPKPKG